MIGNGVTDWRYDTTPAFIEMAHSHGLIDPVLHSKLTDECIYAFDYDKVDEYEPNPDCDLYFNQFYELTDSVNIYDIYRKCWTGEESTSEDNMRLHFSKNQLESKDGVSKKMYFTPSEYSPFINYHREIFAKRTNNHKHLRMVPGCVYAKPLIDYLNNKEVRFDLNIAPEANEWDLCSGIAYDRNMTGVLWIYKELRGKYRMLIFSGTTDGAVPTQGTQRWI